MKVDVSVIRKTLTASLLGLALLPWACHRKPVVSVPPPPPPPPELPAPEPVPAPIPTSIPKPPPGPNFFEVGEKYFQMGDYGMAAQAYETYLRDSSSSDNDHQDVALFRLAMTHAFADSPVHNMDLAVRLLQELIKRFPQSPFRSQADFLLNLQGQVDQLRTDVSKRDERIRELSRELERLKAIDMQRHPTR